MKSLFKYFFPFILIISLHASAPAIQKTKLPTLMVSWQDDLSLVVVALAGQRPTALTGHQISLVREVYPTTQLKLIAIPKDKTLAPLILPIPNDVNEVTLSKAQFKKVSPQSSWIWGITPVSPCGGSSQLHLRFLHKKKVYTNFYGLFAWEIKHNDLPTNLSFYLQSQLNIDFIKQITSPSFKKSSQKDQQKCTTHQGANCRFVFELLNEAKGMSYQIQFEELDLKNINYICPV